MADNAFIGQLDPDLNTQLLNAQQQMQRAQAMYGMGMSPVEAAGPRSPISPLAVLGKLLMAYKGPQAMQAANTQLGGVESKIAQNRLNMMASILRGQNPGAPQGTGDNTPPGGALPGGAPASASGMPQTGVPDVTQDPVWQRTAFGEQLGMIPQGSADAYAKAKYGAAAPTNEIKNAQFSGMTPAQMLAKETQIVARPNQTVGTIGANGQITPQFVAADPEGNLQYQVGQNGQISASGIPGVPQSAAALKGATTQAATNAGVTTVKLPNGQEVPVNTGAAVNAGNAQAGLPSPYNGGSKQTADAETYRIMQDELQKAQAAGDVQTVAGLRKELASRFPQGAPQGSAQAPQFGVPMGASQAVDEMSKKWSDVAANNGSAQQAISFLQNIKQLANSAITGTASDKLAYANGLLSLAGMPAAKDAQTATDLLNKNSNRIVAALGQGSMGTDAARQIIASANPNSHMSKPAIQEAADDLIGQYRMGQSKANVLLPYRNNNDAQGYNTAETQFNQAADPRIWRLQNMAPQDAAAYIKRLSPSDAAALGQKRATLLNKGWLQ